MYIGKASLDSDVLGPRVLISSIDEGFRSSVFV